MWTLSPPGIDVDVNQAGASDQMFYGLGCGYGPWFSPVNLKVHCLVNLKLHCLVNLKLHCLINLKVHCLVNLKLHGLIVFIIQPCCTKLSILYSSLTLTLTAQMCFNEPQLC